MKYVIIGNGTAAVGCIEGIRSEDQTGEITVISSESHHTYSRPLISYLLQGKTDRERMKYRGDDFYDQNGCKLLLSQTAESIDPAARSIQLSNGKCVCYDRLLIAAGSVPFIPPTPGLDTVQNSFTFLSLDDANALEKAIFPDSRVLIIGAGLIGLKCAEGLHGRVQSIQVVDMADRILPSILNPEASTIVQKHLEQAGIRFFLSDTVAQYTGGTAVLQSGSAIDFDILVTAVGVRPNTALADRAGITVRRGIVTDTAGHTNIDGIYAAGDCSESHDISCGEDRVLALLPNAYLQGECTGVNMAGGEKTFDNAIPMNAIGFWGLHILSAGAYTGDPYQENSETEYKVLYTKDGLLKGFIRIGEDPAATGIYTALIRNRTLLDSVDFDLICKKPQFMAFAAEKRREMFGIAAGEEEGYLL